MAFEDLTGGSSGFTSDSDGATANLDINMSEESARNLWDVQAAIQQIAADLQTAVRSASDFQSYLISIRETAQTIRMPSLGLEGGEGGNMAYSGGRVDASSVPIVQSEASMVSRIGEMEENASGSGGGVMGARSPNARPVDPGEFVNQLTQAAWLTSATAQHHPVPQETASAYEQEYNYALDPNNRRDPQVMMASYQGQTGTARAFAASRIVSQNLPAQQFLNGGGFGGVASMIGRLGTVGAIAYAGYQLANAGLETYAQSRAMAISANNSQHGIGWGFEQRLGQAGMAMSPFVSQEDAAQIYNSAISQGWASKVGGFQQGTFGQAVNFMYGAAKDYNMDPAMSAQLLQTNSLGAGESVQALSEQLLTLKQTLDGTGVSTDVANSKFTSLTGMLIASGATGPMSAQIAGGTLAAYSGNNYLGPSGRGADIVQATLASQQTQNILSGLTGTYPGAALAGGGHLQASVGELDKLTKKMTDQVMSMNGLDEYEKAAMFSQMYNSMFGTNITEQDALNMMAVNASNSNTLSEGQKKYLDSQKISYNTGDKSRSAWSRYTGDIKDQASGPWYHKLSYASSWWTSGHDLVGGSGRTENSVKNYSPEVQALLDNSANPDKATVVDENGNVVATGKNEISRWFNDPKNFQKFAAAGSKYAIKDQGATWNATNIGGAGNTGDVAGSNDNNTVYIKLSPEAKKLIDTNKDKLTLDSGKSTS